MPFLFISFEDSFIILFIALMIFGPKKIPEIARSLGRILRHLKKINQEIKEQIWETSKQNEDIKNKVKKDINTIIKEIDHSFTGSVKRDD